MSAHRLQDFIDVMVASGSLLSRWQLAFDAPEYEFVHAVKQGGKIRFVQRIHMNLLKETDKEHNALIQAFRALVE